MDKDALKIKIKLIKKPKKFTPINLKEITIQNDLKNYLFSSRKNRTVEKPKKRYNHKNDIGYQILSLTYSLNEYTKKSKKNFSIINDLKETNDYFSSELNNNLQKSKYFNKKTEEVFHDLVVQYINKGYKIPNLNRTHNLFKKNPLLIENKKDVDIYYHEEPITKGNFILDINNFKEKNWLFLNKINKECNKVKTYYASKAVSLNQNIDDIEEYNKLLYSELENMKDKEKNNIEKLKSDINNIKNLIQKEKEESKEKIIFSYGNKSNRRKYSYALNSTNINNFLNKNITRYKVEKTLTSKNLNFATPLKSNKLLPISFNKSGDFKKRKNSEFNLITEIKKKKKKKTNFSPQKKLNHIKKLKIPGSEKINKDLKSYLEKYNKKYKDETLKSSNIDLLEKIEELKRKIKRKDFLNLHKKYFNISKKQNDKIKFFEMIENKVCNLDKNYIKQTTFKKFEDL